MTASTSTQRPKGFHLSTGMTPTGVVVCDAPPLSEAWFEARRQGITATDLPKILGETEYGNAISVWMDKTGRPWEDEAGEAAEWGNELEPVVAKVWCRRNDTNAAKPEMLGRRGAEWMRASLDGLVSRCPHGLTDKAYGCGLEVKTRSGFVTGLWRDDMPDDVLAQVAWQRIVTDLGHIHVACLFGGQKMREYLYVRDDQLEAFLIQEATRVWQHVKDDTQPLADPNALLTRVLNALHPNREGVANLPATETIAVLDNYETARLDVAEATRRKEAAKAQLVLALVDAEDAAVVNDTALVDLAGETTLAFTYRANVNGVRTLRIADTYRKRDSE